MQEAEAKKTKVSLSLVLFLPLSVSAPFLLTSANALTLSHTLKHFCLFSLSLAGSLAGWHFSLFSCSGIYLSSISFSLPFSLLCGRWTPFH